MYRFLAISVLAAFVTAGIAAAAEPAKAGAGPRPRVVACDGVGDEGLAALVVQARTRLDAITLALGDDRFIAYSTAAGKRNPFALGKGPAVDDGSGVAITGVAWYRRPTCRVAIEGAVAAIRLMAGPVRFHDDKSGWSAPQPGGVLLMLAAAVQDGRWVPRDPPEDATLFLPGATLQRPTHENLPARGNWPATGCDTLKAWNSDRCVMRRAKLVR